MLKKSICDDHVAIEKLCLVCLVISSRGSNAFPCGLCRVSKTLILAWERSKVQNVVALV